MSSPERLRERLRESLKVALSARDSIAVAAFRSAISAVENAEAVEGAHAPATTGGVIGYVRLGVGAAEVARRELSTEEVLDVVRAEVTERTAAAAQYERLGRTERASTLKAEATALLVFLETAFKEAAP